MPKASVRAARRARMERSGDFQFRSDLGLESLRQTMASFAESRQLDDRHTPRNLLLSMIHSTGQLSEAFQWKEADVGLEDWEEKDREKVSDLLGSCLLNLVRLADVCHVDLPGATLAQVRQQKERFPAPSTPQAGVPNPLIPPASPLLTAAATSTPHATVPQAVQSAPPPEAKEAANPPPPQAVALAPHTPAAGPAGGEKRPRPPAGDRPHQMIQAAVDQQSTITAGTAGRKTLACGRDGGVFRWSFEEVNGYDIEFGVQVVVKDPEGDRSSWAKEKERVLKHEGSFTQPPTNSDVQVILRWDNSYSYFYSKTIKFCASVEPLPLAPLTPSSPPQASASAVYAAIAAGAAAPHHAHPLPSAPVEASAPPAAAVLPAPAAAVPAQAHTS